MRELFTSEALREISKHLTDGDTLIGSELTSIFEELRYQDLSGESTKWKRLNFYFNKTQKETRSPNQVLTFIKRIMHPVRFSGSRNAFFEESVDRLNSTLLLCGYKLGYDGEIRLEKAATTLSEANKRANSIKSKLSKLSIHPEVHKFCKAELMGQDYFHAAEEAAKSLAQRIRDMSGLSEDGTKLIDKAFNKSTPYIAFNQLQTESESSVHTGMAMLLKGCFSTIRNPIAHTPRIIFEEDETNTLDYLLLISFLHRRLDMAFSIKRQDRTSET